MILKQDRGQLLPNEKKKPNEKKNPKVPSIANGERWPMTHMVLMAPYMIGNYFCCLNILQKLLLIMEFYGFFKQMRVLKPKALQNKR